jgi:molybdate transport system substrate-binding protein
MIRCLKATRSAAVRCAPVIAFFLSVCAAADAQDGGLGEASLRIAVAADFSEVAGRFADEFSAQTGVSVSISSDSSGVLASQIRNGASFDVFLSADSERPQELVDGGYAVSNPIVYAIGTLALYSPNFDLSGDGEARLMSAGFATLAVADPVSAPYGRAAVQTLDSLGLQGSLQHTLVIAGNVGRALSLVRSGDVEAGFVAFPDLDDQRPRAWVVPASMHEPLDQAIVVLSAARQPELAHAWVVFLTSDSARRIIEEAGFRLP